MPPVGPGRPTPPLRGASSVRCPHCQTELPPEAEACPACHPELAPGAGAPPPPPPLAGISPGAADDDPSRRFYAGGAGGADPAGATAVDISPEEWRAFLGPRSQVYLDHFARFQQAGEAFVATWHWPGFFATGWWFLYRKLYLWAVLGLVGAWIPWFRWAVHAASGLCAHYIYYGEAQRRIRAVKATAPPEELLARLAEAGGVHPWAPWVAVAVSLLILAGTIIMLAFAGGLALGVFFGQSQSMSY